MWDSHILSTYTLCVYFIHVLKLLLELPYLQAEVIELKFQNRCSLTF